MIWFVEKLDKAPGQHLRGQRVVEADTEAEALDLCKDMRSEHTFLLAYTSVVPVREGR